jgi:hypothetical protein
MIDLDADRDTLCEPDPGKNGIDVRQTLRARDGVRVGDATRDAVDSAVSFRTDAHEFDSRRVALMNAGKFRLLEVS